MQLNFICFGFEFGVYDTTLPYVVIKTQYLVRSLPNKFHKICYFLFEPYQQHSS